MRMSADDFSLSFCIIHKMWWESDNRLNDDCPNCIIDKLTEEYKKKIEDLQNQLDELGNKE